MTFGLRNAAQTFQRLMDNVFRGIDYVFPYLDDILKASTTPEEHVIHLKTMFELLRKYGLSVNEDKCKYAQEQVKFLGHTIDEHAIRPLPSKVEAIDKFSQPVTRQDLRRFIGMLNFYRRFLPNAASKTINLLSFGPQRPSNPSKHASTGFAKPQCLHIRPRMQF